MCLRALDVGLARGPREDSRTDRRGRALDDVFVERLWCSVNDEEVDPNVYASVIDVLLGLGPYFGFCNQARPPQALGYRVPVVNPRPDRQPGFSGGRRGLFEALRARGQT